jgi:two-component system chemotaxis response regulator CheB
MIRCLIVDDSPTFRGVLRNILRRAPEVIVVAEAGDGEEAIARALELAPDVITMDVRMPRRDGLGAIREIMRRSPRPIVVVSSAAAEANEQVSFQALKLGAVEVLPKPDALDAQQFAAQAEAIRQAVLAVAHVELGLRPPQSSGRALAPAAAAPVSYPPTCVGIGASTGGPPALQRILGALPADYPLPILVVQHIADGFTEGLVRWLGTQCPLPVRVAREGEALAPGVVLVAPDRRHLMVSLGRVRLDDSPPVKNLRPSATLLFASLARELGAGAAGFLLTGMGDDGAAGLKLMRERGAYTAAQGPQSSVVWGMPRVAAETGAAAELLELEEIAPALVRLARCGAVLPPPRPGAEPRRRRILCADEAESVLASERALLGGAFDLTFAREGHEALQSARRLPPDAVLLGAGMGELTGVQVLEELKASLFTRRIPVVAVLGAQDDAAEAAFAKLGSSAAVKKPIRAAQLLEAIWRAIG